ncbi:Jag N-terminal domain-containing protein [bacterium]|nr:Jag N-terminal domain-containing protein [bacterium]
MTRAVETEGKTVAEATMTALKDLGIPREDADVKIISQGRRGFLGILKGAPARVQVTRRISSRDRAEEIVRDLLGRMHFSCQLHITEEKSTLVFDIETAGADGLLIGKSGNTLSALEYVANRMLQRENMQSKKIVLDVSGYKRRRDDFLKSKALSLAEQVKSARQQVTMEPLGAEDRKIVHAALRDDPAVVTQSIGHGQDKSIVVAPASEKPKSRSRRRRKR